MNSETELAWAAGFFDGEGCTVCANTDRGCRSLQVAVGQVNRDNLRRFHAAIGGLGHLGPPRQHRPGRPISRVAIYGSEARLALSRIWPYLGQEKQNQALSALMKYAFRPVRVPGRVCRRGHPTSAETVYTNPSRGRECRVCRDMRRRGPLPPFRRTLAIELGIGVRQWNPMTDSGESIPARPWSRSAGECRPQAEA